MEKNADLLTNTNSFEFLFFLEKEERGTIPGIGSRMGAMILAEVGDFSNFDSADKILA
jgi:hypothetical protein